MVEAERIDESALGARLAALDQAVRAMECRVSALELPACEQPAREPPPEVPLAAEAPGLPGAAVAEWLAGSGPGVVVDLGVARSTRCTRLVLPGGALVFSPGIIGPLDEGQQALYCVEGLDDQVPAPEQIRRLEALRAAARTCGRLVDELPEGERIAGYFRCVGEQLREAGVEA